MTTRARAIVGVIVAFMLFFAGGTHTSAQDLFGPPVTPAPAGATGFNPISALEDAADAAPGFEGGLAGAINILILLTVLTLAPAILIMTTSFVRIIVVLGLLKQAMGTQTLPPSQVILGLSLFMTFLVMSPTLDRIYAEAIVPYQQGEITDQMEMWGRASQPLRDFMFAQIDATESWSGLYMILNYKGIDTSEPSSIRRADVDTMTLAAAFMLGELKTAFLMGFRVYLPFLVIDIIISSVLISMSMMMLPPVLISLPFKILLFVMVDGWQLLVGSLLTSFAQPGAPETVAALLTQGALGFA